MAASLGPGPRSMMSLPPPVALLRTERESPI